MTREDVLKIGYNEFDRVTDSTDTVYHASAEFYRMGRNEAIDQAIIRLRELKSWDYQRIMPGIIKELSALKIS